MKYRILGSTNLKISVIGIGTWQFGGEWGKNFAQEEVDAMFKRGGELGINFIDTAECYGDHLSESFIGKAVESQRSKWIIATKIGHKFTGHMQRDDLRTGRDAIEQCEGSLKALRTDYIDLLQYHSIRNAEFDDADLQAAMIRLKEQGKIRHIGTSISPPSDPHQVANGPKAQVEAVQVVYNRLNRDAEKEVLPLSQQHHIGVLARVPLASGYLSGKYKPGVTFSANDTRSRQSREKTDAMLKEVEKIQQTEVPAGVPMAQWALAWCLKHPAVTCVIPGCKDVAQVEANAKAAELLEEKHPQTVR